MLPSAPSGKGTAHGGSSCPDVGGPSAIDKPAVSRQVPAAALPARGAIGGPTIS
jgi:hypothetical protein